MSLNLRLAVPAFALAASLAVLSAAAQEAPAVQPPGLMESLNSLAQERATHTSLSLDRSEFAVAEKFIDSDLDGDGRRAAAALSSVSFDNFHYTRPAFYDPEAMASIIDRYHAAGWKHLVNANAHPGEDGRPGTTISTDLWLHFHGADIDELTVLVRGVREMNLIQVSGAFRPLDLVHLSGHFGIPKVDKSAVMAPVPDGK